jgi:PKD domain
MKKIIYIIIAGALIMMSCGRQPYADFFTSRTECEVGDIIYFTNNSMDASYFEWDFGDGYFSNEFNPQHLYNNEGFYTVSLTAFAGDRVFDKAFVTVHVLFPTTLDIEVVEYYDEYVVPDASVILYNSLDDWWDENNPLVEGFTNQNGIVTFSQLDPKRYYVDVWEEYHNNWELADEDYRFIETDVLIPNEVNYFLAWVDYVEPALKSAGRPEKEMRILKLEKVDKRTFEEKAAESQKKIDEMKKTVQEGVIK